MTIVRKNGNSSEIVITGIRKNKLRTGSGASKNSKDKRHQQLLFLDGVSQYRFGGSNISNSQNETIENDENVDATKEING